MMGRVSAACAGFRERGRWRIAAVPVAVLGLTLGVTISASAATTARKSPHSGVALKTLVEHVNIRTRPNVHAKITGHITGVGARVVVNCYARGSSVAGNRVWYHLERPREGYITSYYTNSHIDPVHGLLLCGARPGFSRPYHTLVRGVHIRDLPTTTAPIVLTLGAVGTTVIVDCFTYGQSVSGDKVWYHTVAPKLAYTSGQNLNTGQDPASGVPRCR
jgi:hypothetical protein